MKELSSLTSISPIDGRYRAKVESLSQYFSEFALIQYRVKVEIEYFIALCEIPLPQLIEFPTDLYAELRAIYQDFNIAEAEKIKKIVLHGFLDIGLSAFTVRDLWITEGIPRLF